MTVPHNIYIHVPYCISKCNYCAFFSRACAAPDWDAYANKTINEIDHWANILGRFDVPTIFFGGGTPSLMPIKVFEKIIQKLCQNFNVDTNCEITLESNPGTIDDDKLNAFTNAGVNRLSVGVQSFDDKKLSFLGRRHSARDAINLLAAAERCGIRYSADFIYGLPGDDVSDIIKLCNEINNIALKHCSMYELTLEPGTPFAKMNLDMPSNEKMADMYMAIEKTLNLPRYEVSNYAVTGSECKHNLNVWDGEPYIGIGRGAAGRVLINNVWYEQLGDGVQFEKMRNATRATERVITGMRTVRGVYLDTMVKKIINMDYIYKNPELVHITDSGRIAATKRGMLVLDDVVLNITSTENAT